MVAGLARLRGCAVVVRRVRQGPQRGGLIDVSSEAELEKDGHYFFRS
jgi:hypothetical protein